MVLNYENLKAVFSPMKHWHEIESKDFASYGVANMPEAKVISCYKIGVLYRAYNTMTLYDYGKDDNFVQELYKSYKELQLSLEQQDEYCIFPEHFEIFNKTRFLSVIKLIHNPAMNIIDIFFVIRGRVFCCHTYVPKEEKNLKLNELVQKYEYINHVVAKINGIKG